MPGDIIVLENGGSIPADARLIESADLLVDESSLTGESLPVEKNKDAIVDADAQVGDRLNMVFSGCYVINGHAKAAVTATGMRTEMGIVAGWLNQTVKLKTRMQARMEEFGKKIALIAIVAGAFLALLLYFQGESIHEILINAMSLAVAVIPEALPIVTIATFAFGVKTMARKMAVVRTVPAVEVLGGATVICSDKTGTLTMNKMAVQKVWAIGQDIHDAGGHLDKKEMHLLEMAGLNCTASIGVDNGRYYETGDPTELSIVRLLRDKGIDRTSLLNIFPVVHMIPFDSKRKRMTTLHQMEDGSYMVITKGAVDFIPYEREYNLDDEINKILAEYGGAALRTIAVATRRLPDMPDALTADELEKGLKFEGLLGIMDPPRPESKDAVRIAREAGIGTVMITGDHKNTAISIAREIGIYQEGNIAITGLELDQMTQEELEAVVEKTTVYARVSPEHKIRIVQAFQKHGHIVAMTGDGVNDAPALKAADVGIAMGIAGTDVSKNASDIVLQDDNFATIVNGIGEGRRIDHNIRKVLFSLFSCNISELIIIIFAVAFQWGLPVVALQLLLINVFADGVPDLMMCKEPLESDAMKKPPRNPKAGIFAGGLFKRIAIMSGIFALIGLLAFFAGERLPVSQSTGPSFEVARTMAFLVIGLSSIVNIFNARSFTESIFKIGIASNPSMLIACVFSCALLIGVAIIPGLQTVFSCVPISGEHWVIVVLLSLVPLFYTEIAKKLTAGSLL